MVSREERLEHMMSLIAELDVELGRLASEEGEEEFELVANALMALKEEIEYIA